VRRVVDTGDRGEQLNLGGERGQRGLDSFIQGGDLSLLGFDVVQRPLQQEPVVFAESAGQSFTQVRDLGPQPGPWSTGPAGRCRSVRRSVLASWPGRRRPSHRWRRSLD